MVENLNENVETLASLRSRAQQGVSHHQRRIERFAALIGRPWTFYAIVTLVALWTSINLVAARLGFHALDPPPFEWLQAFTGLAALLMTTTVLIAQNRQTAHSEERAQLELQVNLLAEQKVAKLIGLLEELRRDMPTVRDRVDAVADVMQEPVNPHAVLSALEQAQELEQAHETSEKHGGG